MNVAADDSGSAQLGCALLRSPLLFAATVVALAFGCAPASTDGVSNDDSFVETNTKWATPTWSGREDWYTTTQGSHLVDYDVFMSLEVAAGTTPFASRDNLERLGFVYPMPGAGKLVVDARLPLGVLRDRNEEEKHDYVGFTCAACHTGTIDVKGKGRLLVDGGQGFVDVDRFFGELGDALKATASDRAKAARTCQVMKDKANCDARLADAKKRVDGIRARNPIAVASGPGRLDAVTQILNEVFGDQLGKEPTHPHKVPISFPAVWDATRLRCVQTNCVSSNSMTRNIGETMGVFGHAQMTMRDGKHVVSASAKVDNLYRLEKSLESLESPKWDAAMFGEIDASRKARGEKVFEKECAGCHTEPYKRAHGDNAIVKDGVNGVTRDIWNVTTMPYRDVGTDPSFVEEHGGRMIAHGPLTDLFEEAFRARVAQKLDKDPDKLLDGVVIDAAVLFEKGKQIVDGQRTIGGDISALLVLGAATAGIEKSAIVQKSSDPAEQDRIKAQLDFDRSPPSAIDLEVYRARPLDGIAFTAPYGHNGAWPTLRAVLTKPNERPQHWFVRPASFDPAAVGLDTTPPGPSEKLFQLDTSQKGNLTKGHDWGTELSPSTKDDLLAYLKSL